MGTETEISWCDATFNAWWGCVRVSESCASCYADTWAKRTGHSLWGLDAPRRFFGDKHWAEPVRWNKAAEKAGVRKRVFCSSMSDVFEQLPEDHPQREEMQDARGRLWRTIDATPWLDWLLLTKRPENVMGMVPLDWFGSGDRPAAMGDGPALRRMFPRNMWMGVTAENQERLDQRLPLLARIPVRTKFLSVEPMLGPVVLPPVPGVDWVICGGESGGKARPMELAWARDLRDQCVDRVIAFHFKQWGEHGADLMRIGKAKAGRELDGRIWDEFPRVGA